MALTDRQTREREYFDEWISRQEESPEVSFESVESAETRPWNPYWYVAQLAKELYSSPSQRLLDFGCGFGYYSLLFARIGYQVSGFDVSAKNIATAHQLAHRHGLAERTHFDVGTAETIQYASDYFDICAGIDILHHVEIERSIRECFRILKPGGIALFKEPIAVPIFDPLRNSKFGTWLVPKERSFEQCVTDDERKLTVKDLAQIKEVFSNMKLQRFRLFSRVDAFWRRLRTLRQESQDQVDTLRKLEKFDAMCFNALPFLNAFGGEIVMILEKPK